MIELYEIVDLARDMADKCGSFAVRGQVIVLAKWAEQGDSTDDGVRKRVIGGRGEQ
jgi:hypothetical protein